jgi:hypothetical protein
MVILQLQKKSMSTSKEIWKVIPEFNGKYSVSNLGVVRRNEHKVYSKKRGDFIQSSKLMATNDNGRGYKQLMIQIGKKRFVRYIHRVVAELFIPNPENLAEVNHIDYDRSNNNASNLEWVTKQENMNHSSFSNSKKRNNYGYTGVKRNDSICEKYTSRIRYEGKEIHLGSYPSVKEAVEARNKYIVENDIPRPIQNYMD